MPRDASLLNPKSQILQEHRKKNENWFETRWKQIDGPEYEREFQFSSERKWRFDFSWPILKIACECDGGGHKQFWKVYRNDVEKMNTAILLGWQVYRIITDMVRSDDVQALENLKAYLLKKMEQEAS